MIYIGIDLGTTSLCCTAVESADWHIKKIKTCPNGAHVDAKEAWDKKQNADTIYAAAKNLIDSVFAEHDGKIGAIAISTQMHGIVYTDKSGNALSPLYTWQYRRSALKCEKSGIPYYKELEQKLGKTCPPGYGLATHYTLRSCGEVPAHAHKICSIGDYVAMKLAGNKEPVSDITLAESFGAAFLGEKNYTCAKLRSADIDPALLPDIVESDAVIGTYRNVPVVTAIGDNQASFLGAITDLYSNAVISLGTSGQITCYSEKPVHIEGVETRPFPKKGYILSGASLCGGYAYALLKRFFSATIKWLCGKETEENCNVYKKLDEINPLGIPNIPAIKTSFCGTRTAPDAKALIEGIDEYNFLPQNITAGLVLGIINELKDFFNLFPQEIRKNIVQLYGSGSFFNKHPFVQNCCEKLFGLPVQKTPRDEEGAFGAAINAGMALGDFSDYNQAVQKIKALNDDGK